LLGAPEITQKQWAAVMKFNRSSIIGDDFPVDNVSWRHAMRFCMYLTNDMHASGLLPSEYAFRLPTESEWVYACLGGRGSLTTRPVIEDIEASGRGLSQVAQSLPNSLGLYDMHDNVWEWCYDCAYDPLLPSARIIRGGYQANRRITESATKWDSYYGLRIVLYRRPNPIPGTLPVSRDSLSN
jgi:formylglycine-generating enzyme required for sulfatase activity